MQCFEHEIQLLQPMQAPNFDYFVWQFVFLSMSWVYIRNLVCIQFFCIKHAVPYLIKCLCSKASFNIMQVLKTFTFLSYRICRAKCTVLYTCIWVSNCIRSMQLNMKELCIMNLDSLQSKFVATTYVRLIDELRSESSRNYFGDLGFKIWIYKNL
jgi:hypothetical protein